MTQTLPPSALPTLQANAEEMAALLKLVANANRLQILCCLSNGEANVTELEAEMSLSQPALSQHLARMRQEGILEHGGRDNKSFIRYAARELKNCCLFSIN